jgi:uncharacterized protein YgbK (DUF1537 family)
VRADGVTTDRPGPVPMRELLSALPAPRPVPGALEAIRARNVAAGTRLVVLDDDPTGSQTVRDVPVVTLAASTGEIAAAAIEPHPAVFVLTNSRALDAGQAAALAGELTSAVLCRADGTDVRLVSRSDSTLRGHYPAETDAICAAAARAGQPFDGILLCPAFPEAGRFTVDDVQWVRRGQTLIPAADTDYARDAAFGYTEAALPQWIAARSGHDPGEIASVSIADLRQGGVDHVAAKLRAVPGGRVVVANAADASDLEILCLALQQAEAAGTRLLYRTGPSFVRVRAGLPLHAPLTRADIYPRGPSGETGLVVVGSHVPLTSRQLAAARDRHRLRYIELDAAEAAQGGDAAAAEIARRAGELSMALAQGDVVLATSRTLIGDPAGPGSLVLARQIAGAVSRAVAAVLADRGGRPLRYLVAKGGITSADIATRALGMHRATIAGQMGTGQISVWVPEDGLLPGIPYVVFPGNVGTDSTLADTISTLAGPSRPAMRFGDGAMP